MDNDNDTDHNKAGGMTIVLRTFMSQQTEN